MRKLIRHSIVFFLSTIKMNFKMNTNVSTFLHLPAFTWHESKGDNSAFSGSSDLEINQPCLQKEIWRVMSQPKSKQPQAVCIKCRDCSGCDLSFLSLTEVFEITINPSMQTLKQKDPCWDAFSLWDYRHTQLNSVCLHVPFTRCWDTQLILGHTHF